MAQTMLYRYEFVGQKSGQELLNNTVQLLCFVQIFYPTDVLVEISERQIQYRQIGLYLQKPPRFLPIISNTFIKNSDILQQMSEFFFLPSEKILQCSFGSKTVRKKEIESLLSRARNRSFYLFAFTTFTKFSINQ